MSTLEKLLEIPVRYEPLGGQHYAYVRLEEAKYVAEEADAEIERLKSKLKLAEDVVFHERGKLGEVNKKVYDLKQQLCEANTAALCAAADFELLQKRVDGGIRVCAWEIRWGDCGLMIGDGEGRGGDNATLILDKEGDL